MQDIALDANIQWIKCVLNTKNIVFHMTFGKWPFLIFSDNFSQKDWYKFGMAKNGHSEFFLTIFPKKTGINFEWPKMAILNYFQ